MNYIKVLLLRLYSQIPLLLEIIEDPKELLFL